MAKALLWGLVGSSSLVLGAILGLRLSMSRRTVALLLGFGAGALISAVSFELAAEALKEGGPNILALGLTAGALTYFSAARMIKGGGGALALGALLDGIPEQAAIGISIVAGGQVGLALVAAVFISNVPEALGSAADMRAEGAPPRRIVRLWLGVALLLVVATLIGYAVLGDASGNVVGFTQGFAAGAVLVMLTDSMIPEAVEAGKRRVGLVVVVGYALAALLSNASA